jgi:methionyl-tRNA formyltransferase
MRLVVAGTPRVALPSLDALISSTRHDVVAVVTRPEAPAGRGHRLTPSPVHQRALEAGIEALTPARPSDPAFLDRLAELAPDCCPVVAYGALVPKAALAIPPVGWVNLHFSVLPAWRGAAPAQHALLAGDDITGASTFRLEEGLDTGPVFGVLTTSIGARETAGELLDRLAVDGAQLLVSTLDGIEDGSLVAVPQPADGVSYAPKLTTADARVDWAASTQAVDRRIRGCTPAPGAWTTLRDRRVRLGPVLPVDAPAEGLEPGQIALGLPGGPVVGTGSGAVRLGEVKPEGRSVMLAGDWLNGVRLTPDERFS